MSTIVLGLSGALNHDPSAALYIDDKLVAAAEEERFIRDKHAKGKMPYDAKQAQALANNLKTLMALDMGSAWPAGTSKAEYGNKTHALPEVWSTWPKIAEAGKEYGAAVEALSKVAGNGLEALQGAIGDVGQGCKGCHDDFKEKE